MSNKEIGEKRYMKGNKSESRMTVKVISESGFNEAMLGLSLSFDKEFSDKEDLDSSMYKVAKSLCLKGGGHSKFLESMNVCLDINAPRYWWSEFDTYRVGITKQSSSTMHTLKKRNLTQEDFIVDIFEPMLDYLNHLIKMGASLQEIKANLPEGFLQRRIVSTNYKTLQNIIHQRKNHKLVEEWQKVFIKSVLDSVKYSELIVGNDFMKF